VEEIEGFWRALYEFIGNTYPVSYIVIILVFFGWLMVYMILSPVAKKLEKYLDDLMRLHPGA